MEATLSYKPGMFYDLFSYQKIITLVAGKHRFDAVYMYDKEFRMQMAAQASLKPEQRAVRWAIQNAELSNIHLPQHTLMAACGHCKIIGHSLYQCPRKTKNTYMWDNGMSGNAGSNLLTSTNASQFRNAVVNGNTRSASSNSHDSQKSEQQKGQATWLRFNRGQFCYANCKYKHVCARCGKNHAVQTCTANSSFIPQLQ